MTARSRSAGHFAQPNRVRLIDEYFAERGVRSVDPATAWMDVYRLLLWVDARTGIAHCYESDKSQPGKPWYPRSLVFHEWVSDQFGVDPRELKDHVDWMFRHVIDAVMQEEADEMVDEAVRVQSRLFGGRAHLPVPGDDPRLRAIVEPLLPSEARRRPGEHVISDVLRKVYAHMGSENKRANLLGRGFEDVLARVLSRLRQPPAAFATQTPLGGIPGFRQAREGDKTEKVDLWVGGGTRRRILVSAKWSIRADREKQLANDFGTYVQANEWRDPFEYVWITNEFDPARLVANASQVTMNRNLLDCVVHICPDAVWVVHGLDRPKRGNPSRLRDLLETRRIVSLGDWLRQIA